MGNKVFLIGMPGSGKTTLGKQLAKELKKNFIDLDAKIELAEKRTISDVFATSGESYFRELERKLLLSVIKNEEDFVMATGGGAACFFDNLPAMKKAGLTVYLKVSPQELLKRLKPHIAHRPLLSGKTADGLLTEIEGKLEARKEFYESSDIVITNDNIRVEDLLQAIERKSPR